MDKKYKKVFYSDADTGINTKANPYFMVGS